MKLSLYAFVTILISLAVACIASGESSLTIYNEDFAVVRESLPLDLKAGTNEVRVTEITARVEPDSVILRDPQGKQTLQILEQNYRADPVSQGLLLSLYEGYEIDFLVRRQDRDSYVRGKIVRSGYDPRYPGVAPREMIMGDYVYEGEELADAKARAGQPIVEVNGKLRFGLPGEPLFPSLRDDTILKPTLHWLLQTDAAGRLDAELSYITGGMKWEADYSMIAPAEGDAIDMIGWITVNNQSGRTFENARIKLMAGDVSKIQPQLLAYSRAELAMPASASAFPVSEKTFDEYHLYALARPATLHDRETKQVEFLRAEGVQAQRLYVYDGARIDSRSLRYAPSENLRNNRDYGTQSNPKVWVMREIKNSAENHLGIPLPKGRMRFYRLGDDSQLEFVGENTIDHTPRDETVRVYTGDAFDLVGERRRMDYRLDTERNWLDESFEIKVRNRKEQGTVEVRVVEHLYRWSAWEIAEKSEPFTKTDGQTIEFRVQVPAGQEKIITYKAHYTW